MRVFTCAGCGNELTARLTRVALPAHAFQRWGHTLLGPLMRSGTYAIASDPIGPPWRSWEEVGGARAEALGWYAPVPALSFGPRGAVIVAPGDLRGTRIVQGRPDGHCIGLDGRDGHNLSCERCSELVATRIDDCSYWQAVWLDPRTVRTDGVEVAPPPVGWRTLLQERPGLPPSEPEGFQTPQWAAAVGVALAHVLARSGGDRVAVPDELLAETFRRPLQTLLPDAATLKTLRLSGPGLPTVPCDLALVPQHPLSGEPWTPGPEAFTTAGCVPLDWDVWAYLASLHDPGPVTRARPTRMGALDELELRQKPVPLTPWAPFRVCRDTFLTTLARLPEVRRPWLRRIYDRVSDRRQVRHLFW
jgi:hypothetical protein